ITTAPTPVPTADVADAPSQDLPVAAVAPPVAARAEQEEKPPVLQPAPSDRDNDRSRRGSRPPAERQPSRPPDRPKASSAPQRMGTAALAGVGGAALLVCGGVGTLAVFVALSAWSASSPPTIADRDWKD